MNEIYISTDIESDGPIPGPHSMLSLGAAAYTADKTLVSTFSANLETLPGAQPHPKTAEWWATQPEAWAACRTDLESPEHAMARYITWIRSLDGKPVFVAYPAGSPETVRAVFPFYEPHRTSGQCRSCWPHQLGKGKHDHDNHSATLDSPSALRRDHRARGVLPSGVNQGAGRTWRVAE